MFTLDQHEEVFSIAMGLPDYGSADDVLILAMERGIIPAMREGDQGFDDAHDECIAIWEAIRAFDPIVVGELSIEEIEAIETSLGLA